MDILVQLPGVAAMVCLFLSYQQKNRKGLIMCKLSADVFWALHYALLGAFGGMIPNLSGIFRELVFVNREDKKWANFPLWPVFFIVAGSYIGIINESMAIISILIYFLKKENKNDK